VIGAGLIGLERASVWRRLGLGRDDPERCRTFLGAADETTQGSLEDLPEAGLKMEFGVAIS
jgi:pyruvate/2-oxoglutarate dehydrogenase complex dihydrolipoamide dehydrogenase (E3) component